MLYKEERWIVSANIPQDWHSINDANLALRRFGVYKQGSIDLDDSNKMQGFAPCMRVLASV